MVLASWGDITISSIENKRREIEEYAIERGKTKYTLSAAEWRNYRNRLILRIWQQRQDNLPGDSALDVLRGTTTDLFSQKELKVKVIKPSEQFSYWGLSKGIRALMMGEENIIPRKGK